MLFEINDGPFNVSGVGFGQSQKVAWIKQCREETYLGLKDSKDLCDFLAAAGRSRVTIDTKVDTRFDFLESQAYRINTINDGLVRLLVNEKEKPSLTKTEKESLILKRTAIALIRNESIASAIGVLKVYQGH